MSRSSNADMTAAERDVAGGSVIPSTEAERSAAASARIAIRVSQRLPWLVLPPGMSCQYVDSPELAAVPRVNPWFVGVYSDSGLMTPMFDLNAWLDRGTPSPVSALIVVVDRTHRVSFSAIDKPRVVMLPPQGRSGAVAPDAFTEYVEEKFELDSDIYFEFDPFKWIRRNAKNIVSTIE